MNSRRKISLCPHSTEYTLFEIENLSSSDSILFVPPIFNKPLRLRFRTFYAPNDDDVFLRICVKIRLFRFVLLRCRVCTLYVSKICKKETGKLKHRMRFYYTTDCIIAYWLN